VRLLVIDGEGHERVGAERDDEREQRTDPDGFNARSTGGRLRGFNKPLPEAGDPHGCDTKATSIWIEFMTAVGPALYGRGHPDHRIARRAIIRAIYHMAYVIAFRTARFDVSKESPNPINPIAGESVLNWLRPALAGAEYRSTEPGTEDWGWYMDVEGPGGAYLVGASAEADSTTTDVEWVVQVHRARSMKDKLLGRNKLAAGDPLCSLIERLVRADTEMELLSVDAAG
jgi:hypothetical protein